jgi:sarcosine oxidase
MTRGSGSGTDVDVAVVGLGLGGAATAWALSRQGGRSVAAFDAFEPGHVRGSSHGHARIFRRAYPDPFYIELTGRAERLWEDLQAAAGETLLTRVGGLDHGSGREPERLVALLRRQGAAAELLDPDEAARRYPALRFDGPVAFTPGSGVIDPERTIGVLTRLAERAGAHIAYNTKVESVEPAGDGVRLRTAAGECRAGAAVVAAGAWTGPLLAGLLPLPLPLTVTQQQVFFFRPRAGLDDHAWPTLIHQPDADGTAVYGLPEGGLYKLGEHALGNPPTSGDARTFTINPAARDRAVNYVRRWLPGLDPAPVQETTCLYTATPNEDFVLDRHGPIVICSACSGHGAKFTPLIGELAAGLAVGRPPLPRFTLS